MNSPYSKRNTREMVQVALIIGIIIVQGWVPLLGFINFGPIAITIIPITVILGTLWLGTKNGAIFGLTFGINSFLRAWLIGNPVERMIFTSPLVSILPRVLMPILVGLLVHHLLKKQHAFVRAAIAGFTGSILNTLLVLTAIGLFKASEYTSTINGANQSQIWTILIGVVTANGIPEAVIATIITPILYMGVKRAIKTLR